jgi:hypothetical protein
LDWLFEDPWLIVGLGALSEALLGVAAWRTRRGAVLAVMGGVVVLTGLALLLERWVVTDREAVEDTLRAAAAAVLAGDERKVLEFIAPEAPREIQDAVRRYLNRAEFTNIVIRAPDTQVMKGAQRTARVRFTAHVKVRLKSGDALAREEFPVFLEVRFRKERDTWLVTGYEQLNLTPGSE